MCTNGDRETYHSKNGIILNSGDVIQVRIGSGYGYLKNPTLDFLASNIKNRYTISNKAKTVYGYNG